MTESTAPLESGLEGAFSWLGGAHPSVHIPREQHRHQQELNHLGCREVSLREHRSPSLIGGASQAPRTVPGTQ